MSIVYSAANREHAYQDYKKAIGSLLDGMDRPLSSLISPGTRVFVKPFLQAGQISDPSERLTTHPDLLRALIEILLDHGARVSFGGGGAALLKSESLEDFAWAEQLSKDLGAPFVSFASTGGRLVPSHLLFPRDHLIANALLDADVIVSCANLQPHGTLGLSGSIRNMFNAVVGNQQQRLYSLFPDGRRLGKAMADVCRLVRPDLSILDLTTVRDRIDQWPWKVLPVNRIIAGRDPAAVDSVAASAVGFEGPLWTSVYGERCGLGAARCQDVRVIGPSCAPQAALQLPAGPSRAVHKPTAFETARSLMTEMVLRPRPQIDTTRCTECEACIAVCFSNAIARQDDGRIAIDSARCVECGNCVVRCEEGAVRLVPRHSLGRGLERSWERAKNGISLRTGGLALELKLRPVKVLKGPRPLRLAGVGRAGRGFRRLASARPHSLARSSEGDDVAMVVGVGPKLGSALVRRLRQSEMRIVMVARDTQKLQDLEPEGLGRGDSLRAFACDITDHHDVRCLFEAVEMEIGTPSLVIYNVEHFIPGSVLDIQPAAFQISWQANCYGGFLVGQRAAFGMVRLGRGTIIFGGATASRRGRSGYTNLAVGKFGLRALAQAMARELGPKGVHVAHVVLDGEMLAMNPAAVADTYYNLYRQPDTAWSHEVDLRRYDEIW